MYSIQPLHNNSRLNNNNTNSKYRLWERPDLQWNANSSLNSGQGITWIDTEKAIKVRDMTDKSRVLQGKLKQHGDIVIKIGTGLIKKETDIAGKIGKQRGFIRFLGHFNCSDDYLEHNGRRGKKLCKGKGANMSVIIMPYYHLGSIGGYAWKRDTLPVMRSLLKQTLLFYLAAFEATGFIHGDLHAWNILMSETSVKNVKKTFKDGQTISVPTLGMSPVIMDFENSKFSHGKPMDLVNFYYDVQKLFQLLPTQVSWLSRQGVQPIVIYVGNCCMSMLSYNSLYKVFDMINDIN